MHCTSIADCLCASTLRYAVVIYCKFILNVLVFLYMFYVIFYKIRFKANITVQNFF